MCVCVADRRCLISNVFVTFSHDVDRTRIKLFSCQLASVFYLKRGCFSKSVAETKKSTKSLTKKMVGTPIMGLKIPCRKEGIGVKGTKKQKHNRYPYNRVKKSLAAKKE